MAGAADIIGLFHVIKKIKPKNLRLIGAFGATENLPGHQAQKPGDVWKAYNGKTVEVVNTDAEGRLVLADVISYIDLQYKPDYLIDLATLTGSIMVALGYEYAGLFGNDEPLKNKLLKISKNSYEKIWFMPLNDAFRADIKSEVADLKNLGSDRWADSSKAAAFLEEFVGKNTKWAHLDIAGPAIINRPTRAYLPKGGTGFGVKTLVDFINSFDNQN